MKIIAFPRLLEFALSANRIMCLTSYTNRDQKTKLIMNARIFFSPAIFCILFLSLVVLSQGQIAKPATTPGKVKPTASIKQGPGKLDACFKWWTQVDPRQVLVTIDIESLTDEEIVEGIGCLLRLKGNKNKARIYGRTRSNLNGAQGYKPPKNPATIEIAALYYISYLFHKDWEHAGAIALYDEEEEDIDKINSPEYAERAFRSYENWFTTVKQLGLKKTREQKIYPLTGSGISWS